MLMFSVYDSGTIFSPAVLDITDDDIKKSFMAVSTLSSFRTLVQTLTVSEHLQRKSSEGQFSKWDCIAGVSCNG